MGRIFLSVGGNYGVCMASYFVCEWPGARMKLFLFFRAVKDFVMKLVSPLLYFSFFSLKIEAGLVHYMYIAIATSVAGGQLNVLRLLFGSIVGI